MGSSEALLVLAQDAGVDVGYRLLLDLADRPRLLGGDPEPVGHVLRPREEAVDLLGVGTLAQLRELREEPLDVADRRQAALPGRGDDRVDAAGGLRAPGRVREESAFPSMCHGTQKESSPS